jgi:hypothetical protein
MRKIIRKINRAVKDKTLKVKKPVKIELLIRILECPAQSCKPPDDDPDSLPFLQDLKQDLINLATNPEDTS